MGWRLLRCLVLRARTCSVRTLHGERPSSLRVGYRVELCQLILVLGRLLHQLLLGQFQLCLHLLQLFCFGVHRRLHVDNHAFHLGHKHYRLVQRYCVQRHCVLRTTATVAAMVAKVGRLLGA